jgi:hypothetical protein
VLPNTKATQKWDKITLSNWVRDAASTNAIGLRVSFFFLCVEHV